MFWVARRARRPTRSRCPTPPPAGEKTEREARSKTDSPQKPNPAACWRRNLPCPKKVDTQFVAFGSCKDDEAMGFSRRKYSREFKIEAVKQVVEQGRSVSDVAKALGLNLDMLSRWRLELAPDGVVAPLNPSSGDEEFHRLRRQLATAQQERDILKEALAYFAKRKNKN